MNSFSSQRTETTAPSSLTVQLTAEELGKNGSCIAWTEVSGKTVRVILPGTLPGDAVEAVVELPKKGLIPLSDVFHVSFGNPPAAGVLPALLQRSAAGAL